MVLDKAASVIGEAKTARRKAHSTVYFILDVLGTDLCGGSQFELYDKTK